MPNLEDAKLTDEEVIDWWDKYGRDLADAATAKALWWVADWLAAVDIPPVMNDFALVINATQEQLARVLREMIEATGIERPKVEA